LNLLIFYQLLDHVQMKIQVVNNLSQAFYFSDSLVVIIIS
jgi:hypothetical protein